MKYIESNIPEHLRVQVCHLHPGNTSHAQLKKLGHTKAKYVTLAKLRDKQTDQIVAEGVAACSPKDQPSRRVGRAVAIGRALADYDLEKSITEMFQYV